MTFFERCVSFPINESLIINNGRSRLTTLSYVVCGFSIYYPDVIVPPTDGSRFVCLILEQKDTL